MSRESIGIPAIEIMDLTKIYKKRDVVLDHVTFNVPQGSICGIIGENGAGKTTMFKILLGLAKPSSGGYKILGKNYGDDIFEKRKKIGFTIESPIFYANMTAKDNIFFNQIINYGETNTSEADFLLHKVELDKVGKKKVRDFSYGMKQRLSLAVALIGKPAILLLDEPLNGLDPLGIIKYRELILRLNKEEKVTFVISSHILSELDQVATHYIFMNKGRLLESITKESLEKEKKNIIKISTNEIEDVCKLLKNIGHIRLKGNSILLYDSSFTYEQLTKILTRQELNLSSITMEQESTEEYYERLLKTRTCKGDIYENRT